MKPETTAPQKPTVQPIQPRPLASYTVPKPGEPTVQPIQPRLLRLPAVLATVGASRSAWYLGIQQGRYPKPVKLGARAVAWRAADIDALIESLAPAK